MFKSHDPRDSVKREKLICWLLPLIFLNGCSVVNIYTDGKIVVSERSLLEVKINVDNAEWMFSQASVYGVTVSGNSLVIGVNKRNLVEVFSPNVCRAIFYTERSDEVDYSALIKFSTTKDICAFGSQDIFNEIK